MAITPNNMVVHQVPAEGAVFTKSLYTADASGAEVLVAGVEGYSIYVTRIILWSVALVPFTIGSGASGGAVVTTHFGPIQLSATGLSQAPFCWKARRASGFKCVSGQPLVLDAGGVGAVNIYVEGRVCKDPT
jgi:hypothetical protein